jgi:hypothetical protein
MPVRDPAGRNKTHKKRAPTLSLRSPSRGVGCRGLRLHGAGSTLGREPIRETRSQFTCSHGDGPDLPRTAHGMDGVVRLDVRVELETAMIDEQPLRRGQDVDRFDVGLRSDVGHGEQPDLAAYDQAGIDYASRS